MTKFGDTSCSKQSNCSQQDYQLNFQRIEGIVTIFCHLNTLACMEATYSAGKKVNAGNATKRHEEKKTIPCMSKRKFAKKTHGSVNQWF